MWSRNLKNPQVAYFREHIGATFQLNEEKKEIDYFRKFFPVSLVEKIVAETNAYAVRCIQVRPDKVWVPTTFPEMMAFLGIHVVFSIVGIPSYTLEYVLYLQSWPGHVLKEFQSTFIWMILPKIHQEDNQGMTNFVTFVQFLMNCLELQTQQRTVYRWRNDSI